MKEQILLYLQQHGEVKTGVFVEIFNKERTTIYRRLKKLEQEGEIIQVKKGTYTLKENIGKYFDTPFRTIITFGETIYQTKPLFLARQISRSCMILPGCKIYGQKTTC